RFRPEAANFFSQIPPESETVDRRFLHFKSKMQQFTIYDLQFLRTKDFPAGPYYRRYFPDEYRTYPEDSITDYRSVPSSTDMRGVSRLCAFRLPHRLRRVAHRNEGAGWDSPCCCRRQAANDRAACHRRLVFLRVCLQSTRASSRDTG